MTVADVFAIAYQGDSLTSRPMQVLVVLAE